MGKKLTTMEWIDKAKSIHGSKYDYTNTIYTNAQSRINLHCNSCDKQFSMLAKHHINNKSGCRTCSTSERVTVTVAAYAEQFVEKANMVHNNKYKYDDTVYLGAFKKVKITCPIHGNFLQTPDSHTNSKHGCPKCGITSMSNKQRKSLNVFVEEAQDVHGSTYDYSNVEYINGRTPVKIICNVHGEFEQSPDNHIRKVQGCPHCSKSGFKSDKAAILYYLRITYKGSIYYKIGITGRSIKERFSIVDLSKIEVVFTVSYEDGQEAYDKEQSILSQHKKLRYKGGKILMDGNTEIFTEDIFSTENSTEAEAKWYKEHIERNTVDGK